MIRWMLTVALIAALPVCAVAQDDPAAGDVRGQVLAAFLTLNDGPNADAQATIVETIEDAAVTEGEWRGFVETHYESGGCSPAHVALWDAAIRATSGEAQHRAALVAGMWAAGAMKKGMPSDADPMGFESTFGRGLDLLHLLGDGLGPGGRVKVLQYLGDFFGEAGAAPLGALDDAKSLHAYMQLGLTVRNYALSSGAPARQVAAIMGLQGPGYEFWNNHGIFLFDPGVLNARQFAIVNQLAGAIPQQLHNIGAFIVSGTANVNRADLLTPYQIVFVDPIDLSVRVNPDEFYRELGPADAPEFAVSVAQRIFAAVQEVQFAKRPDLALRRNIILDRAGRHKERFLRRYDMIPPARYYAEPGLFLPSVGYLWIMDSVRTFGMAGRLFEIDVHEPMDAYLLFADMLSGGGNQTYLYVMAPDGSVQRDTAPIKRAYVSNIQQWLYGIAGVVPRLQPTEMYVCNGIVVGGRRYWFDVDELGSTLRIYFELFR